MFKNAHSSLVFGKNKDALHTEYIVCGETFVKPVYQHFDLWNISPTWSAANIFIYVLGKHTGNYFHMDSPQT